MTCTARTPDAPHPLLPEHERQRCEVWTRVMGYHRPVASFNVGKKGEFHERQYFIEPGRSAGDAGDRIEDHAQVCDA
nr:anaerobic ribonucleoside-triphosphate reductase [uncultured Aquabacterium sp.]